MFGKKRREVLHILLLDEKGSVRCSMPSAEYELPREVTVAKSIEYFNDPEPCNIHGTAVQKRVMMEMMEACPPGKTVALTDLSEDQRAYFGPGVAEIRFEIVSVP